MEIPKVVAGLQDLLNQLESVLVMPQQMGSIAMADPMVKRHIQVVTEAITLLRNETAPASPALFEENELVRIVSSSDHAHYGRVVSDPGIGLQVRVRANPRSEPVWVDRHNLMRTSAQFERGETVIIGGSSASGTVIEDRGTAEVLVLRSDWQTPVEIPRGLLWHAAELAVDAPEEINKLHLEVRIPAGMTMGELMTVRGAIFDASATFVDWGELQAGNTDAVGREGRLLLSIAAEIRRVEKG